MWNNHNLKINLDYFLFSIDIVCQWNITISVRQLSVTKPLEVPMSKLVKFDGIKTTKEIAELCGVTPATVCRWAKKDFTSLVFVGEMETGKRLNAIDRDDFDYSFSVKTNCYKYVEPVAVTTIPVEDAFDFMDAVITTEDKEQAKIDEQASKFESTGDALALFGF